MSEHQVRVINTVLALSDKTRRHMAADIDIRIKQNDKSARKPFAITLAGAAGFAASAFVTASTLPVTIAGAVTMISFMALSEKWGKDKALRRMKEDMTGGKDKIEKPEDAESMLLKKTTRRVVEFNTKKTRMGRVLNAAMIGSLAAMAAGVAAPALAPVALPVFWGASALAAGALAGGSWYRGALSSTREAAREMLRVHARDVKNKLRGMEMDDKTGMPMLRSLLSAKFRKVIGAKIHVGEKEFVVRGFSHFKTPRGGVVKPVALHFPRPFNTCKPGPGA